MTEETTFKALTEDELLSLCWIAATSTRIAIPVAHFEKLLDAGYVTDNGRGPTITKLGESVLSRKMEGTNG